MSGFRIDIDGSGVSLTKLMVDDNCTLAVADAVVAAVVDDDEDNDDGDSDCCSCCCSVCFCSVASSFSV